MNILTAKTSASSLKPKNHILNCIQTVHTSSSKTKQTPFFDKNDGAINHVFNKANSDFGGLGSIGISTPKKSKPFVLYPLKVSTDKGLERKAAVKKDYQESRHVRYDLQNTLTRLFANKLTKNGKTWAVHNCLRAPISVANGIDVIYSPASKFANFKNLQHCKRAFCTHCAEKKAIENKKTLEAMRACHLRAGGAMLMMTLTNSHNIGDSLESLIEAQKKAMSSFTTELARYDFFEEFGGKSGAVRAWELTYGKNGWHPHFHIIYYTKQDIVERDDKGNALEDQPQLAVMRNSLAEEWQKACAKFGLIASLEHGVDLRDGSHASKYIGKYGDEIINMKSGWGSSDELSKAHLKVADKVPTCISETMYSEKGVTPWQILKMAHDGDKRADKLFVEYAYAMHNTAQLYFYPKTKNLYDLEAEIQAMQDAQDIETAKDFEDNVIPEDTLFINIQREIWLAILHCDMRSQLLVAVELDADNRDFEKKRNTYALINHCSKIFIDYLQENKHKELKQKITQNTIIKRVKITDKELIKHTNNTQNNIISEQEEVPFWFSEVPFSDCQIDFEEDFESNYY